MLLVIGSALLVAAVVLLPLTVIALRRWLRQRGLAQLRPGVLAAREGQRVTLTGAAAPGPDGPISSGLAGAECVWHGHEVLRHYWPLNREPSEGAVRERACDSIADYGSEDLFGIVAEGRPGDGDRIFVDPGDTEPRGAELCLKRVVGRPQPGVASPADDLLPRVRGRISGVFRGETIEFEYREWVIRPGARIRVTGLVQVREGRVVLAAPEDGTLGIEHGVDDQPVRVSPRRTEALALTIALAVCSIAGAVLTAAAL
ncbi:GIDE domain-containing protein [Nocardiopsis sp. HUAS JQ3]|uniref:GIDE domain-containing protein n=1 Tax=Nocardiopsis sp. HUAS JQ3 TaxID=3061629 RepID=UPI0023A9CCBD|nr:GIDE domain-containing protein [Nocardiopsis sp. HUAS JQ3]WDZ90448.1 GIDE domain-containing protein [Nocardiopsis sp. HUAS JQ3]